MGGIKKINIKRTLRKLKRVKTWQLILILIPLLFIEATIMRFDHIQMTELKKDVIVADEEGDDEKIYNSLQKLKQYVFSHTVINVVEKNGVQNISFGSGPIYLEHQYQRKASEALAAAEAQAGTDENPNGNVFAAAMGVCKPLAIQNGWAWNSQGYLDCMTGEIAKYPTTETLQDTYVANLPSTALFRYDFSSPIWTPTLSGFVMILCAIVIIAIIFRALLWCVLRLALVFLRN
ncbi:hypothetical protein IJG79_00705 [Candidatus Saccharibacteria bacterium]|nr:hypothetical protein [Candidatus Saccharibacteria bacterium]